MDASHYFFAFYIFVMLVALLFIYKKLDETSRKTSQDTPDKEKRLFQLYQNLDDMMVSIEEYMEQAKKEITAEREQVALLLAKAEKEAGGSFQPSPPLAQQPAAPEISFSHDLLAKQEKVLELKQKGLNIDQIAQEMQISRGEVALIQGIAKRK